MSRENHLKNSLSLCVLGSSSAGNATVIWNHNAAILIDCGFGPSYIEKHFRRLGLRLQDLRGVFITHIHGDHINEWSVNRFVRDRIPIYCPSTIESHLQSKYATVRIASHDGLLHVMKKSEMQMDGFLVSHFDVPHDSDGGCYGYAVSYESDGAMRKVCVSTDLAYPTKSAITHMADSDALVIESNYDLRMLAESSRPDWLKRRIQEDGHLSNDQCAETVLQVLDRSKSLPSTIALAHVSRECNTNRLAVDCTRGEMDRIGVRGVRIVETHPQRSSEVIRL